MLGFVRFALRLGFSESVAGCYIMIVDFFPWFCRCTSWTWQSCQLSWRDGGWYGGGDWLLGQLPQDLELVHGERLAMTTFPYHPSSTTDCVITFAVVVINRPCVQNCKYVFVFSAVFCCTRWPVVNCLPSILPTVSVFSVPMSSVVAYFQFVYLLATVGDCIHLASRGG